MSRALATDPYQAFSFYVTMPGINGGAVAGFTTVTTPEITVETSEYKTGTMKQKQKYPGNKTYNDITLTRGLVKSNSELFDLIMKSQQSGVEYRFDFDIIQKHRDGTARVYHIKEAFGIRAKMSTDLDANASDVAIEEMDVQYEYFTVDNDVTVGDDGGLEPA